MNMDDIKLVAKKEKELETFKQTIRINNQDIEMKFVIGKCLILIMKQRERETMEGIELPN